MLSARNRRGFFLYCAVSVLATIVILEADRTMPVSLNPYSVQAALPQATVDARLAISASAHASTILARPPFASTRRPPPQDKVSGTSADTLPRLSGIMVIGAIRRAIFENGSKPQISSIGDHLGAYLIVDIAPITVTVEGPQGIATLRPGFDGGNDHSVMSLAAAGPHPPSLLDRLNTQPPPVVALPRPPSLTQMLSRLPRSH